MIGVFAYLVLMLIGRVDGLMNPRPFFSEMPESLRVLDAQMSWVETTNGPRIYVIGMLTNQSQVAWKDVEFQCRFFGTNGVMIDASYPGARLTILPGSDAAFRGTVTPACAKSDYHAMTTTVSSARNARAAF
jgi:hypothetical protein